jgi:3-deoxy-manno-octulosonate cytidylyltransferase (CMP-KDO synthetase)
VKHQQVFIMIPARLASSRFPRKVLAAETGKPLIAHVWERACMALCAASGENVVIAADSQEVVSVCEGFGARAVLTDPDHPNGSSRLAEAAALVGARPDDVVINVQGDEPEMDPAMIDAAAGALRGGDPSATIATPIVSNDDFVNPNIVKVVRAASGRALYFSRAPVPHARAGGDGSAAALRHVGLYAYTAGFLQHYITLAPTPLERTEMLEQLRILEHGYSMAVAVFVPPELPKEWPPEARAGYGTGVDTQEQYAAFVARYKARPR